MTHRPIWVDAVCINHKDKDEKRGQIQLMNMLYRRVKYIWVWLDLAPLEVQIDIPKAIALLPRIVEEAQRGKESAYIGGKEEVAQPLRNLDPDLWRAILHLLKNPWYQRV